MNLVRWALAAGGCLLGGLLFFAVQRGCVILQLPLGISGSRRLSTGGAGQARLAPLFYWRDGREITLQRSLILPKEQQEAAVTVAAAWLDGLFQERLVVEKITVQEAVVVTRSNELFLSISRPFLPPAASTEVRWRLVCALLKTLKAAGVTAERCTFLVNHKPWHDDYLDLAAPWPFSGLGA